MAEGGELIPITDEQAKLGQEIVKVFGGLGSFFKEALGSVPADLVGYLGGDWLRVRRMENIARMMEFARERLESRAVEQTEPVSLTLAIPLLRGAADESREELQNLWARLLAAALDPSKAGRVRQEFAEVLSKMDPVDALVLQFLQDKTVNNKGYDGGRQYADYAVDLKVTPDEFETSVLKLERLHLIERRSTEKDGLSALARELLRALSD